MSTHQTSEITLGGALELPGQRGEGGDACDGLDFSLEVSHSSILPMPCPLASHSTPPRIFAAHGKYQGHGLLSMFEFVEIDPPMFCSYHIYLNDIYNTAYTHIYMCLRVYICEYVCVCASTCHH